MVAIEHNFDVLKPVLSAAKNEVRSVAEGTADWVLDLGPEGGVRGGEIVAEGTPEDVVKVKGSFPGGYLAPMLAKQPPSAQPAAAKARRAKVPAE